MMLLIHPSYRARMLQQSLHCKFAYPASLAMHATSPVRMREQLAAHDKDSVLQSRGHVARVELF